MSLEPADVAGVNPRTLASTGALAHRFAEARPFRHLVIDDFLETGFTDALLEQFPPFDRGNSIADDGKAGEKATFERVRALGSAYRRLDELISSRGFLAWLEQVTGIPGLLYDPWYLGGGSHENRHGAGLDPHVDFNFHPIERWHRRLNLIVYLNHEWETGWGGALNLYSDPRSGAGPEVTVSPMFNRCVIFETHDGSWHGFNNIALPEPRRQLTRRSIALYFYTDPAADPSARPAPHSTVYVGRRLPPQLHAGHVLSESDMHQLRGLVESNDLRMDALYAEIGRLMALVRAHEGGFTGSAMYMARKAFARLRLARQGR